MQIIHDMVSNPTPKHCIVGVYGQELHFKPYTVTPVQVTNDPRLHMGAIMQIRKVAGPHGVTVLDRDELSGGPGRDEMTEAECRKYAEDYLEKVSVQGNNRCVDVLRVDFIDHPSADDRRLAGANKQPMHKTRHAKRMLAMLEELEAVCEKQDNLDDVQEIEATRKLVRQMPSMKIDLDKLGWADLKKHARVLGHKVPGTMTREDVLDLIHGKEEVPKAAAEAALPRK